jgi:glycerate kinase
LRPEDFTLAEGCLGRLAEVAARDLGIDAASEPGAGAAGGLGFGLRCFANGRLEPGFELFAAYSRLEERVRVSDLVITGEGAVDASTLMGKGVGEVARLCRKHNVPCLALAGRLPSTPGSGETIGSLFTAAYAIVPELASADAAENEPGLWLRRLAAKAAVQWPGGS